MTTIAAEWSAFDERVAARYPTAHTSVARGASNSPLVLEDGFRFGLFNIDLSVDRVDQMVDAGRPLVLVTGIVLPPRNALSLALVFQGEALERVGDRLEQIRQTPVASGRNAGKPKGKANKVRVYLHASGLYLRQASDPPSIGSADDLGPPLWADAAWYADVGSEPDLPPVELAWLAWLKDLLHATQRPVALQWLPPAP